MMSIFDQGAAQSCPTPFNMAAHVLAHAPTQPDKVALAVVGPSGAERWSYGKLYQAVMGTGAGLLKAGLTPGDKVLMRIGNTVDFPIAYLGAIAVGLVPVPTSSQLTEPEVARMVSELSPAAILHDPSTASVPHPKTITLDELRTIRDCDPAEFNLGDPNRPAYVIYTSGTSGQPRAVVHAHRAIWARRMMYEGWYGLTSEDRLCHAGAFNWTYTLGTGLMDPWASGATAIIPKAGMSPEALPLMLRRHDATIFAAAPGVYRKILNHSDKIDLPKLRHGLSAGEKMPLATRVAWKSATGTEVFEAFGMSECSTFISSSPTNPADPNALGRPQPGRRVALMGEDGPVPLGDEGVIAVHRDDPGLMLGYFNQPEDTAARFHGDWFLTGDLGVMDADHQITYMGRADDMMNAGGYRVSPIEVENAMSTLPGISAVAATDVEVKPDVRVIAAFYTGQELAEDILTTHAETHLARYKQPRLFIHRDSLPTNANGKIRRRVLRDTWKAPT